MDDVTGEPIQNFVVQSATPNPQRPEAVNWQQFTTGDPRNPGRISLQRPNAQKMWRILSAGYISQLFSEDGGFEKFLAPAGVMIRLKRGGEIQGVVVNSDGKPVAYAQVLIPTGRWLSLMDGNPEYSQSLVGSTMTDAADCFMLRGQGNSSERVVVTSPNGLMVWPTIQAVSGRDVKIVLPEPGRLLVRLSISPAMIRWRRRSFISE